MSNNWCVFAIQRLRDYEERLTAVENLTEQLESLSDQFTAIRAATTDSTPVQGGNENKREQMLISNISMRDELQKNLDMVKSEISITEKGLASLSKSEREILQRFYINRTKGYVQRLCDDLYISKAELYRQKDIALKKFTMACYGIVEL